MQRADKIPNGLSCNRTLPVCAEKRIYIFIFSFPYLSVGWNDKHSLCVQRSIPFFALAYHNFMVYANIAHTTICLFVIKKMFIFNFFTVSFGFRRSIHGSINNDINWINNWYKALNSVCRKVPRPYKEQLPILHILFFQFFFLSFPHISSFIFLKTEEKKKKHFNKKKKQRK